MFKSLKSIITQHALHTLKFDDCKFTSPFLNQEINFYREWLKNNNHGNLAYLLKHLPFKENPEKLLSNVKSAIIVIKNYKNTFSQHLSGDAKTARFALGQDYHIVMKKKLELLENFIKEKKPEIQCYIGVDSSPIMEKALAVKAGIGFQGKNSLIINPKIGSYFFIGVILTTYSFKQDHSLNLGCGDCKNCLIACPTQALSPFILDAKKCISYKTQIDKKNIHGWVLGCDLCQEVCPYNAYTPLTDWPEFKSDDILKK